MMIKSLLRAIKYINMEEYRRQDKKDMHGDLRMKNIVAEAPVPLSRHRKRQGRISRVNITEAQRGDQWLDGSCCNDTIGQHC